MVGAAELSAVSEPRAHRVRAAILAGRYDVLNLQAARGLRQALSAAGDTVDYIEVPEGHSPATWRDHLGKVLVSLFGRTRTENHETGGRQRKDH